MLTGKKTSSNALSDSHQHYLRALWEVRTTRGYARLSDVARLEQRLSVMPAVPRPGDMLQIRSVLRNPTARAIPATWSICGLHVQDLAPFTDPSFRCGGYSVTGALSPGDSVQDGRNLLAPAVEGDYVLQVRQLVDPSVWLTVTIPVRAP